MELIASEYEMRPTRTPEDLAEWLEEFHTRLAERLHQGEAVLDMIPE